jgi:hypothetical protein
MEPPATTPFGVPQAMTLSMDAVGTIASMVTPVLTSSTERLAMSLGSMVETGTTPLRVAPVPISWVEMMEPTPSMAVIVGMTSMVTLDVIACMVATVMII